jgi:hypothetical protein
MAQGISERCGHVPAVDLPLASAARRGFAGLIENRGRQGERTALSPPSSYTRMLAALPATNVPRLHVGVADSLEQIEAADRLVRKRYAWRGYRLEAFEHQDLAVSRARVRREIVFFAAVPQTTLGTVTLRLDGPEGLHAEATHPAAIQRARR